MVSDNYIAKKIRELRKNAGMSVDEFGEGVGRSGKTVSAWETGRNVPSADMLITICRFFNVNIDFFYPSDVTEQPDEPLLSPDERELVRLCRSMSQDDRETLLKTARSFAALTGVDRIGSERAVGRSMR